MPAADVRGPSPAPALPGPCGARAARSYGDRLLSFYGADPLGTFAAYLPRSAFEIARGLTTNLARTAHLPVIAGAFGGGMLLAALWRAYRREPDGIYVLAYLAVLLAWPFPGETRRFVLVLLPVPCGQRRLGAAALAAKLGAAGCEDLLASGLAIALLSCTLPDFAAVVERHHAAGALPDPDVRALAVWYAGTLPEASRKAAAQRAVIDGLERMPAFVAARECVIATKPLLVELHAHRAALPRRLPRSRPPSSPIVWPRSHAATLR